MKKILPVITYFAGMYFSARFLVKEYRKKDKISATEALAAFCDDITDMRILSPNFLDKKENYFRRQEVNKSFYELPEDTKWYKKKFKKSDFAINGFSEKLEGEIPILFTHDFKSYVVVRGASNFLSKNTPNDIEVIVGYSKELYKGYPGDL